MGEQTHRVYTSPHILEMQFVSVVLAYVDAEDLVGWF